MGLSQGLALHAFELPKCWQGQQPAWQLSAAKSRMGHAEAGAGVLGMLHVLLQLQSSQVNPLTHLRSMNPHVASVLGSHKAGCLPAAPRQASAFHATVADEECNMGVSSFAFQVPATSLCCRAGKADGPGRSKHALLWISGLEHGNINDGHLTVCLFIIVVEFESILAPKHSCSSNTHTP